MNTTTAAAQANVTVATVRTWCRKGVVVAAKVAGRWVIDAASLARRIEIGARRMTTPAPELSPAILRSIRRARYEYTPRRADKPALAGRYVLPAAPQGLNVWRENGLIDDVTTNGRTYYVLSAKAEQIRTQIAA